MGAIDQSMKLGSPQNILQLSQQQRTDDQVEVFVGPPVEDQRGRALRREQRRDKDIAIENEARHLATGGVLFFDCHPHRLFLTHARSSRSPVGQDRLDALATAQQRQVARVGEDNGLGTTVRADHYRIGVGPAGTEDREQRRQL